LLVPQLGAPPYPCCLLCLPVIEHGDPVSVLQIVRGGNPVLGIATVGQSPPRKPSATLDVAPVAEREPLFEAPPVRLGADQEPQAGGAGFKVSCRGPCAPFLSAPNSGKVLGNIRRRTPVYSRGR
jgi:hypothetical protein